MKYAAYTDNRETPLEWAGPIPAHWQLKKIGHLALLKSGENIVSEEIAEGGEYPVFGGNGFRGYFNQYTHDGDFVLIGRQGALCGNVNYARGKFWASEHALVAHSLAEFDIHWFGETLRAMNLNQYSVSAAQPGLAASTISALRVPFPPVDEQQTIARFLDAKTAQIDELVAQKRQLIAKLKEKRSALIARTVTRGLPPEAAKAAGLEPNPEMKDSGVDWFGFVPIHWTVSQLKWAVMFQRGHDLPSEQREEGAVPLVTSAGVSATHNVAVAKGPGIVTGRYGTIGQFHLVQDDYWPLNTTLYSINLHGNSPGFLCYMLEHLSPLVLLHSVKSAVPGVDRNDLHPMMIALPPVVEQRAIASYLDRETAQLEALAAKVESAIARLTEYRQALITSAVTGKIDVRGFDQRTEQ